MPVTPGLEGRHGGGWAMLASGLLPGAGQVLQRRWRPALVFAIAPATAAVVLLVAITQDRTTLLSASTEADTLRALAGGAVLWVTACLLAAFDAAAAARPHARKRPVLVSAGMASLTVALAIAPGSAVAWTALRQDQMLDRVFTGEGSTTAMPSSLDDLAASAPTSTSTSTSTSTTTSTSTPSEAGEILLSPTPSTAPATAAEPPAIEAPSADSPADRWNLLLLGSDAGPRRWGTRTDAMVVVSVDRRSGDVASISVPRNLERLPLPEGPLRDRFPRGFPDLANALWGYVSNRPELGLEAGQVMKGAMAELMGIPIHHYVMVDMPGFVHIIDVLGGVDVNLSSRVRLVPNMDGRTREATWVGPGPVHMNGNMALSFARTRETDSDFARMGRQRCLLFSIVRSLSLVDLLRSYPALAAAVEDAFRADLPRQQVPDLIKLLTLADFDTARSLVLIPPLVQPGRPDLAEIRQLVAVLLVPPGDDQPPDELAATVC